MAQQHNRISNIHDESTKCGLECAPHNKTVEKKGFKHTPSGIFLYNTDRPTNPYIYNHFEVIYIHL